MALATAFMFTAVSAVCVNCVLIFATKFPFHWLANPAPSCDAGAVTLAFPVRSSAIFTNAAFSITVCAFAFCSSDQPSGKDVPVPLLVLYTFDTESQRNPSIRYSSIHMVRESRMYCVTFGLE